MMNQIFIMLFSVNFYSKQREHELPFSYYDSTDTLLLFHASCFAVDKRLDTREE